MRRVLFALASMVVCGGAWAQWFSDGSDNPFENTQMRWVFTAAESGAGFGFRCEGADPDNAGLLFITRERITDEAAASLSLLSPQLSIIVDNGERRDLDASIDAVEISGAMLLRVIANGETAIVEADRIGNARRRVSVALSVLGKTFHATNFGVRGSRREIDNAFKSCGISRGDPS